MDESSNLEIAVLSEGTTKKAFEERDWPVLRSHLEEIGLDESTLDALLGHLRRTHGFILRYPNQKQELRRDAFLKELRQYVRVSKGEAAEQRVVQEIDLLLHVERGYRSILLMLDAADISKLAPNVRVAAYLRCIVGEYADVLRQQEEKTRKLKQLTMPNAPLADTADGQSISVDAVFNSLVTALSTSLIMESHKNRWHDSRGVITLPVLPAVGDNEVLLAASTQALAMCWSRWQRTEERTRFLGGKLEQFTAPNLPSWAPSEATSATLYTPDEAEFFDYAANERVLDRLGQQFMEVMTETGAPDRVSGIAGGVPLLPAEIVSLSEFQAAGSLGDILTYEIANDTERLGGLRLVEWVRGYAVLQQLATDSYEAHRSTSDLATIIPRSDLLIVLERCGLTRPSAEHFIEQVTLKIASDDLFDSPLIQMQDDKLMVFGPALITANLAAVVLSTLATLQEPLSRKGHSLERAIVSLLQEHQLHARGFKVTRDGQEYEYDAVLAWGNYVFVFECKNRSLSSNRPVNAYYFELGVRSAVRQVKRLAEALRKYPDILATEMKVALDSQTIVPCVLNSLPYARTGDLEGVYCTDSSSLQRFLSHRYLFIKSPHRIRKGLTVMHRVAVTSLWKEDRPGPEDLVRQLQEPFQLKLLKAHTELRWGAFPIGPTHVVAATEFTRKDWSVESVTKAFGVSAAGVQSTLESIRRQVRDAKRRVKNKRKRKAKRPK
jgi:hypothetical protein